jgi:hypothetical protein
MPEHVSPGIHVEETGAGPKPIEGVPTGTAAFLGETGQGPVTPRLVTSFTEYTSVFGGDAGKGRYMPHAVAGFFENGGHRLYVCRIPGANETGNPTASDFQGNGDTGLSALLGKNFTEVAIVYAPGMTPSRNAEVLKAIVDHCEQCRFRFAVIDSDRTVAGVTLLDPRGTFRASAYAAFYFPWIKAKSPFAKRQRIVPPGGHVAGVYARTDAERGVFKAPANQVIRGATGLKYSVGQAQQDVLNPRGVNVIREFPDRGIRVWGSRTLSNDPEWKYVNIRRLFIFLEHSIDTGMQWAAFEPNGDRLWARVVDTIRNFLRAQWRAGALQGQTENEAFFVKCDRTTMTQDDIDDGRLICLVGAAPVSPAEFVILRFGWQTADPDDP